VNTIKDCVNCLYKKACILVRKRELADQKAKIREWLRKQNEVSDGFLLDFDEEFEEVINETRTI